MKKCKNCNAIVNKDIKAFNKKMFGKAIKEFYCIDCLSILLNIPIDEILNIIEDLKEEGCVLFNEG